MSSWKDMLRNYRHLRFGGKLAAARTSLEAAIEQLTEQEFSELADLLNQLARLSLEMKDPVAAEIAVTRAIEAEKRYGPPTVESDHMAAYHVMLAHTLRDQNKYSEALIALDSVIELYAQHVNLNDELIVNLNGLRASMESNRWREK